MKFKDFANKWLSLKQRQDIKSSTVDNYSTLLAHLNAGLGDKDLGDLCALDIESFVLDLKLIMSPRRANTALSVLRMILESAADNPKLTGMSSSPAAKVRWFKIKKTSFEVLTLAQIKMAILHLPEQYRLMVLFLALTGCRPGEAAGLVWDDIDLVNATAHIHHTVTRHAAVEAPKTETSNRFIFLPPDLVAALKVHRRLQPDATILFPNGDGTVISHSLSTIWKKALISAGLPVQKLYHLRHGYITRLLDGGIEITWIQDQVGHSNLDTIIKVYRQKTNENKRAQNGRVAQMMEAK